MSENITKSVVQETLPKSARAFQQAIDGTLTEDVWREIINAQVEKAKGGDRSAAKFLLDYAGGMMSFRGATFVQENHTHHHTHADGDDTKLTSTKDKIGDVPDRTPDDFENARERRAQEVRRKLGV